MDALLTGTTLAFNARLFVPRYRSANTATSNLATSPILKSLMVQKALCPFAEYIKLSDVALSPDHIAGLENFVADSISCVIPFPNLVEQVCMKYTSNTFPLVLRQSKDLIPSALLDGEAPTTRLLNITMGPYAVFLATGHTIRTQSIKTTLSRNNY